MCYHYCNRVLCYIILRTAVWNAALCYEKLYCSELKSLRYSAFKPVLDSRRLGSSYYSSGTWKSKIERRYLRFQWERFKLAKNFYICTVQLEIFYLQKLDELFSPKKRCIDINCSSPQKYLNHLFSISLKKVNLKLLLNIVPTIKNFPNIIILDKEMKENADVENSFWRRWR